MTNKEAIEILRDIHIPSKCWHSENEALDLAIKALEERPQGDLISREALKKDLICFYPEGVPSGLDSETMLKQILHDIDNAPTVPPEYFPPCEDCNKKMEEIRRAYDKMKSMDKERRY